MFLIVYGRNVDQDDTSISYLRIEFIIMKKHGTEQTDDKQQQNDGVIDNNLTESS